MVDCQAPTINCSIGLAVHLQLLPPGTDADGDGDGYEVSVDVDVNVRLTLISIHCDRV